MKVVYEHVEPLVPNALHHKILDYILNEKGGYYDDSEPKVWELFGEGWHTYNSSFRDWYEPITLENIKKSDKWIYPIEIYGDWSLTLGNTKDKNSMYHDWNFFDEIPKETIKKLKTTKGCIFITNVHEGFIPMKFFSCIHKICKKNEFPPSKIIIMVSGNYNVNTQYDYWINKNKEKEKCTFLNYHYFLYDKGHEYSVGIEMHENQDKPMGISSVTEKDYEEFKNKDRPKKFLCFNRRMRPHRAMLVSEFVKHNLLDENLISFQFNLDNDFRFSNRLDDYWSDYKEIYPRRDSYNKRLKPYLEKVIKIGKQMVDHNDLSEISGFRYDIKKPFCDTYYSVVTETNFFWWSDYITEKTWKCIGNYHPFIIFGRPNSLSEIRDLGFKTFHPYIDESYVKVDSNSKRYKMIIDEILRLNSMSVSELTEWYSNMDDILVHNKKLFLKLGTQRHKKMDDFFKRVEECIK